MYCLSMYGFQEGSSNLVFLQCDPVSQRLSLRDLEPSDSAPCWSVEGLCSLGSFVTAAAESQSCDRAANQRFCLISPPPSSLADSILLMLRRPPPHLLTPSLVKDACFNKKHLFCSVFAPICRHLNALFAFVCSKQFCLPWVFFALLLCVA